MHDQFGPTRRNFLKLASAGLAASALPLPALGQDKVKLLLW